MFDFFSKEDKQLYNMLGHLNMAEKEISLKDNSETEIYEVAGPDDKYAFLHEAAIIEYHGTLFAAWYNCEEKELIGPTPIRQKRSKDGGKTFGFQATIYYANVISIDKSYYEAAQLDGASKLQQVRYITLVLLKPVIIMMILLAVGKIFYSDFGLFYQVTQNSGAIYSTTNTIDTYVYRTLIQTGDVGMSAAAGVYQSVVGFLIVLITNLLLRKISPEDSLF